jgi:hypothetical protein
MEDNMSKTEITLIARQWPSLYGDFRQGFLTEPEVRSRLWEVGYSANEAYDISEAWADELDWEDVAANYRAASRK